MLTVMNTRLVEESFQNCEISTEEYGQEERINSRPELLVE